MCDGLHRYATTGVRNRCDPSVSCVLSGYLCKEDDDEIRRFLKEQLCSTTETSNRGREPMVRAAMIGGYACCVEHRLVSNLHHRVHLTTR